MKKSRNIPAVIDASFSVTQGETFMIMGLSGSGKSTIIRCLNRLHNPSAGSILIDDEDITKVDDRRLREIRRTKIAMVFQHFALLPHKTVLENVEFGLKIRGTLTEEDRKKAQDTLDVVGLNGWGDRLTADLSGGMQQRVGLARALATDPEILLMDEPFSALDPLIRRDMQDELINLQQTLQKTIIFITHDLNEALKMGDHIAVMKDGRIVQIGTPEEIVSSPADEYVAAFTSDVNRGLVFSASSIMKPADTLTITHDTVKTASVRLRQTKSDAMYVVDRQRKPVGLVTDQDIAKAVRKGDLKLEEVMMTDFPQTEENTPLGEVLTLCGDSLPIAVVSDKGRFRGILEPLDVLSSVSPLSSESNNNGNTDDAATQREAE
ncbi:MAG: betaine/proline/choline family ABC transporter ATP-binding protein [Dehalogenimonas sp.]|uniref:Betaine/proline/choline family ABC transporter ATP-binding protein n=1 Tax=Candidatus Dehalogenimonas loeffleri TaxID=3127115 RepID=A0ABZ2J1Z2_9CHLR|nr:betaine/proline/choline family ABC transporter ATP-binding protein [Dehalogenimonas sp.]